MQLNQNNNENTNDEGIRRLADEVSSKFKKLFLLYAKCSTLFNSSSYFTDEDIVDLQSRIVELMKFYRNGWPEETVTPKLHMLECHVVPFIERWRYGIGKYGEQDGEGLHAEFNNLSRIYCRMR